MTPHEIIRALATGDFEAEELTAINEALRLAYRHDRQRRLDKALETINGGCLVEITGRIRPAKLLGVQGTVGKFNSTWTRADIHVTGGTRFGLAYGLGQIIRGVPLVCLKKVEPTNHKATPPKPRQRANKRA